MSTHRNIFYELDDAAIPYPSDFQVQTYRLGLDFETLDQQKLLLEDLASCEDLSEDDQLLVGGMIGLIEELERQRIPNPGGPQ